MQHLNKQYECCKQSKELIKHNTILLLPYSSTYHITKYLENNTNLLYYRQNGIVCIERTFKQQLEMNDVQNY